MIYNSLICNNQYYKLICKLHSLSCFSTVIVVSAGCVNISTDGHLFEVLIETRGQVEHQCLSIEVCL